MQPSLEQQWASAAAAHAAQHGGALGRPFADGLPQQHQQQYGLPGPAQMGVVARDMSGQLPRISMAQPAHHLMLGGELMTNFPDFGFGSYAAQAQPAGGGGSGTSLMSHPRMAFAAQQQQQVQQQRPLAQSAPAAARRAKAEPRDEPWRSRSPRPADPLKRGGSPPVVPVAAGRSRRANAGKRMARSYSDEEDSPPPRVPKAQRSGLAGSRHGGSGPPAGRVVRSIPADRHTPGAGEPSAEDLEAIDALHALIGGN